LPFPGLPCFPALPPATPTFNRPPCDHDGSTHMVLFHGGVSPPSCDVPRSRATPPNQREPAAVHHFPFSALSGTKRGAGLPYCRLAPTVGECCIRPCPRANPANGRQPQPARPDRNSAPEMPCACLRSSGGRPYVAICEYDERQRMGPRPTSCRAGFHSASDPSRCACLCALGVPAGMAKWRPTRKPCRGARKLEHAAFMEGPALTIAYMNALQTSVPTRLPSARPAPPRSAVSAVRECERGVALMRLSPPSLPSRTSCGNPAHGIFSVG